MALATTRSKHHSRLEDREAGLFGVLCLCFLAWSLMVAAGRMNALDAHLAAPALQPRSMVGQIAEAFALATHPVLILIAILVAAVVSFKARMRRLGVALGIAALGIPVQHLLSAIIDHPRPVTLFADSLSNIAGAFPSGHVTAMTLAAWVMVTLTRAHRRRATSVLAWSLAGIAAVLLTALSQWAMGLASVSDIVGGLLLGATAANLGLSIGGIDSILSSWAHLGLPPGTVDKHAAIIVNPTKFDDLSLLRRRVEAEVLAVGWRPTMWLETTPEDAGHDMARRALEAGVDLVMVAGGDGTVRAVSSELTGTTTPLALLPSGTGNLLARNLSVSLDTDEALHLALHGRARPIDVVRCTWDKGVERFVVMAGLGLDAQIMESTNDDLKRVLRAGAYAVAAVQNAVPDPFTAVVALDDAQPAEQQMVMALMGNVGTITGGMALFPQAHPDDGVLDLMLASPDSVVDWARLGAHIITGKNMEGFEVAQARRLSITTNEAVPFELDGDTVGLTRHLEVTVEPRALLVVAPRR
ncbi:diacylglycerol kinase family protein [Actinomyces oricola]|uniref:diacylglycerol kinase family protein n=1 Tax=Actinomyces oricola TaxID=206043 RepID=UPI0019D47151